MSKPSRQSLSAILALATAFASLSPAFGQGAGSHAGTGKSAAAAQQMLEPPSHETQMLPAQTPPTQVLTPPPQGTQPTVQQVPPQKSGLGHIIGDVKNYVKDMVHVDVHDGNKNVKVKVPFVKVDVDNGQSNRSAPSSLRSDSATVKVNAPFVHVTKSGDKPASVDAPFVHVNSPTQ